MEEQESSGNIKEPDAASEILEESNLVLTPPLKEDTDVTLPTSTSKSNNEIQRLERPPAIPKKKFESAIIPGFPHRLQISHDCFKRKSLQKRVLCHIATAETPLFSTVLTEPEKEDVPSFLVTGCGLRNLASLQEALQLDEQNKLKQLYNAQEREGEYYSTPSTSSSNIETELAKSDSSGTQTNASLAESDGSKTKKKLMYLMGLHDIEEDEEENVEELEKLGIGVQEPILKTSLAMRNAQRYLRIHNIFKFFEFIIAHMLSALPDNPIEFFIDLLNKCLVFRSGFSEPPLLYNRKHLESLFYLMDRMRTNYIDVKQYKTGMHTLGICSFNDNPPLSNEGLVAKEDFIEEAYNQLTDQLNDLLRRRWMQGEPPEVPPPPPTPQVSIMETESSVDLEGSCLPFTKTRLFLNCNKTTSNL